MISNEFHLLLSKWDQRRSKLTAQHNASRLAFARAHQNWQIQHWHPVENTHYSGLCQQLTGSWGTDGQAAPLFISPLAVQVLPDGPSIREGMPRDHLVSHQDRIQMLEVKHVGQLWNIFTTLLKTSTDLWVFPSFFWQHIISVTIMLKCCTDLLYKKTSILFKYGFWLFKWLCFTHWFWLSSSKDIWDSSDLTRVSDVSSINSLHEKGVWTIRNVTLICQNIWPQSSSPTSQLRRHSPSSRVLCLLAFLQERHLCSKCLASY